MKVLGIDPGLADAGYGIVDSDERGRAFHVAHGVVRTSRDQPLALRLERIHRELEAVIALHSPDVAAIEKIFFSTNVMTAVDVAQARGVAILATARAGLPLAEYSPLQIKRTVAGYGRASKEQVQLMVKATLALPEIPRPDHAADALAVAICRLRDAGSAFERAASQTRGAAPPPPDNPNKALLAQTRRGRRRR